MTDEQIKQAAIQRGCIERTAEYYGFIEGAQYYRAQLTNPWISVKDRLPEEGQAVIVRLAIGAGNHTACNYIDGQFVWALCIETSNINIQSRLEIPAITHWMPIPQI